MQIGDVYATAVCGNCNRPIRRTWWGNGGVAPWEHVEDERWGCGEPSVATPKRGTTQVLAKPEQEGQR